MGWIVIKRQAYTRSAPHGSWGGFIRDKYDTQPRTALLTLPFVRKVHHGMDQLSLDPLTHRSFSRKMSDNVLYKRGRTRGVRHEERVE